MEIENQDKSPRVSTEAGSAVEETPEESGTLRGKAPPATRVSWWGLMRDYHSRPVPAAYPVGESVANVFRYWMRGKSLLHLVLFLVLCGVFFWQAAIHWVAVIDDSYITFRFVDMFVKGHGWRYSPMGPRVEGFTNFLWAVLLIIPHWLNWDLMFVSKILGMASGVLTMAASWGLARAIRQRDDLFNLIPAALLATSNHFSHWGMMGLETLLQCALVVGCYWRFECERRDHRLWLVSPLLAVLAAMTRIDSLFYLSPLGIYGFWLVCLRELHMRRFIRWGVYAAIPFVMFWGWRWTYFGEMWPNTYYAKQRHIINEGHARAVAQLDAFYFNQAGFKRPIPTEYSRIPAKSPHKTTMYVERAFWDVTFAERSSFLWMNFWMIAAGFCLVASAAPILGFSRPMPTKAIGRLARSAAPVSCLVLVPWAMNFYYVYHVNADWMPCYRFFQMALPYIGVAGAVGFGFAAVHLCGLARPVWAKRTAYITIGGVSGWLLLGTAVEQLSIHSVSIYGPGPILGGGRPSFWYLPDRVMADYRKGFSPPLAEVANYLLLNTQNDGWIYMHDIGQPLWFSEHLNLYDADGLTDPVLAHTPSTRGSLPTPEEYFEEMMAHREGVHLDREEREILWRQTLKRDFDAHVKRNADWLMKQRRPEYLIIFVSHSRPDPKTPGFAYPDISREVWEHPARESDYTEMYNFPKIGNVYNHIYRRSDVPEEVPDEVKLQRLYRVIERNPRMPYLVRLLYSESQKMKNLEPADRERITALVKDAMERWTDDPVIAELASVARAAGDSEVALKGLLMSLEKSPDNITLYYSLSSIYQKDGDFDKAIEVMWKANERIGEKSNAALYHLIWLNEQGGHIDEARRIGRTAVERLPDDARSWSDYAAMLERVSRDTRRPTDERLEYKKEALTAFEGMVRALGETPDHIDKIMKTLRTDIADLSGEPVSAPENSGEPEPPQATAKSPGIVPDEDEAPPVVPPHLISTGALIGGKTETSYSSQPETAYQSRATSTDETVYR